MCVGYYYHTRKATRHYTQTQRRETLLSARPCSPVPLSLSAAAFHTRSILRASPTPAARHQSRHCLASIHQNLLLPSSRRRLPRTLVSVNLVTILDSLRFPLFVAVVAESPFGAAAEATKNMPWSKVRDPPHLMRRRVIALTGQNNVRSRWSVASAGV